MTKPNISVEIVADSINPADSRLTSFILRYPRFIHSEFMTHRMISRNAASSRAIPVKRMIANITEDPAHPEYWGAAQKGMQAAGEVEGVNHRLCSDIWSEARFNAIETAGYLLDNGLHKQIANRVLEPWNHISVLASATDWDNFFLLRAHPQAQPEFQVLAYRMLHAYLNFAPEKKSWGDWHIPFGGRMPDNISTMERVKIATARGARLSYETFDGDFAPEKDYALHDKLADSKHWSPFEHPAKADSTSTVSGNFRGGWKQYRSFFPKENQRATRADLAKLLEEKPSWIVINNQLASDGLSGK